MAPSPKHSESEPESLIEEEEMDYVIDEDAEIIVLDENDINPGANDPDENDDETDVSNEVEHEDDSKVVFTGHQMPIFCINQSRKDLNLIVTGSQDDRALVWKIDSGELIFECKDHKDSVIASSFSKDGKYLMSADMSGVIIVYQVENYNKIWDFECSDLEWCQWHPLLHILFAGTTDGEIYMFKIPSGDCKIYQGHGSKASVAIVSNNNTELYAGYENGELIHWNLKSATPIFTTPADDDCIICLDSQKSGKIIACGTREGNIKLFNSNGGKLIHTFRLKSASSQGDDDMVEEQLNSVESLSFLSNEQYLVTASLLGNLDIWDLHSQRKRHSLEHPSGISKVICSNESIVTACLDGVIRVWTSLSGEFIREYKGHLSSILDIVVAHDDKYLLSAGDDNTARVFEL